MGGRDDPHVDLHRLRRADRPHLLLLQHAQQLDLQRQRHVADLVEENGAAAGRLEQPLVVGGRASERTLDVAEQLRLEQLLGDRAAVDRDERLAGARAGPVDGARQQFLAGAALAEDHDAGVAAGHQARFAQDRFHLRAARDDLLAPRAFRSAVVGGGTADAELQRLLHLREQRLTVEGLGDVAEHAALSGGDGVGNRAVRRQDDHRQGRVLLLERFEQRDAVHPAHAQIGDHQIRAGHRQLRQRGLAAFHRGHAVAGALQADRQQTQQIGVVVYQHYTGS